MDFLDDLDNAFDQMLNKKDQAQADQKQAEAMPEDDALNQIMANQQSSVIRALVLLFETAPRRVVLPALDASIQSFLEVEPSHTERAQAVSSAGAMLRTAKGSLRQRLSRAQKTVLRMDGVDLLEPSAAELEQARGLLQGLRKLNHLPTEAISTLYGAGIWQASQVADDHHHQLVQVTGWRKEDLEALKAALPDHG